MLSGTCKHHLQKQSVSGRCGTEVEKTGRPLSGFLSWKMFSLEGSSGSSTIQPVTHTFLQGLDLYCRGWRR